MKKLISVILSLCVIANIFPIYVYADDTSESSSKQYEAVFKFDDSNDESEVQSIMVMNDCVYADLQWLTTKLNLNLNENNSENYISKKYKNNPNKIINNMITGYDNCFENAPNEKEYVISKPDVNLQFFFRYGSSKMYAYSEYMGELTADLGGSIVNLPNEKNSNKNTVWIPLAMFLNIFDSSFWIDDTTIHILPSATTTVDILHTNNLDKYFYDPYTDGGISNSVSNIKKAYITFYNKIKNLFQESFNLNFKKALSSFSPKDYEDMSNTLALQLCTPNEAELEMLKQISTNTANTILYDYSTLKSTGEKISDINDYLNTINDEAGNVFNLLSEISKIVDSGTSVKATDLLNHFEGQNWDLAFKNTDEFSKTVKEALYQANKANKVNKWAENINFANDTFSVVAPVFLTYITSANEISSSVQSYNNAVQGYISEFGTSSNVFMPKEMLNVLDEKSKMYQNQSTSIFDNDEFTSNLVETSFISIASLPISKILDTYKISLLEWQLVSLGWDISEMAVNGISGGAFDSLNALNNSTGALMLEYDSAQVINSFKTKVKNNLLTQNDLEKYKNLELVRLKSYLITREDVLSYYKFWEKKKPNEFPYAEKEITKDENQILNYMSALLSPNNGVTKEALETYQKNIPLMNKLIILVHEKLIINDDWKKAYINEINSVKNNTNSYHLIDINNNGIPELFINFNSGIGGINAYSFYNNSIYNIASHNSDFFYIEDRNLLKAHYLSAGVGNDSIFELKENECIKIANGSFGRSLNWAYYKYNVIETNDEEKYNNYFNSLFDSSLENRITKTKKYDYIAIIDAINNYGNSTKNNLNSDITKNEAVNIYKEFIANADYMQYISKWLYKDGLEYAIFDVNSDDTPELFIQSNRKRGLGFIDTLTFTISNNKIIFIDDSYGYGSFCYSKNENLLVCNPMTRPFLNNSSYPFYRLNNNKLEFVFSVGKDEGVSYIYQEASGSKQISDEERKSYFDNVINFEWKPLTDISQHNSSKYISDLRQYLSTNIYDFINITGDFVDVGATSAIEFKNNYLIVEASCGNMETQKIDAISIIGECNYSIDGITYGMSYSDVKNILSNLSGNYSSNTSEIIRFNCKDNSIISINFKSGKANSVGLSCNSYN